MMETDTSTMSKSLKCVDPYFGAEDFNFTDIDIDFLGAALISEDDSTPHLKGQGHSNDFDEDIFDDEDDKQKLDDMVLENEDDSNSSVSTVPDKNTCTSNENKNKLSSKIQKKRTKTEKKDTPVIPSYITVPVKAGPNDVLSVSSDEPNNKKRKMSFENVPSAAVIAQAAVDTLKAMNIDPNSKEGKAKKRQIRNRMSAQHHRDRKNAYIKELEERLALKDKEIKSLKAELQKVKCEHNPNQQSDLTSCETHSVPSEENHLSSANSSPLHYSNSPYIESVHDPEIENTKTDEVDDGRYQSPLAANGLLGKAMSLVSMSCVVAVMLLGNFTPVPQNAEPVMQSVEINRPSGNLPVLWEKNTQRRLTTLESKTDIVVDTLTVNGKALTFFKGEEKLSQEQSLMKMEQEKSNKMENFKRSSNLRGEGSNKNSTKFNNTHFSELSYLTSIHPPPTKYITNTNNWPITVDYPTLSYSSVVVNDGRALLDPSLSMTMFKGKESLGGKAAYPSGQSSAHEFTSDFKSTVTPLLTTYPHTEEKTATSPTAQNAVSINNQHQAPNINGIKSNILNLQLPVNSVRVGKSWSESADTSIEKIMDALNITDNNVDNKLVEQSVSLEINCVILGAKLIPNSL